MPSFSQRRQALKAFVANDREMIDLRKTAARDCGVSTLTVGVSSTVGRHIRRYSDKEIQSRDMVRRTAPMLKLDVMDADALIDGYEVIVVEPSPIGRQQANASRSRFTVKHDGLMGEMMKAA